ncbi:alpha/beta hydrolase [Micromonospora sp. NPDC049559]|uniref:alpha/beta fold hydrolase n=1 Tax=Micromonospora sp. NPDC049559 TaxID=3155923 RepID=UPI0034445D1E
MLVDAGGVRLSCEVTGDPVAPPVVLLHGLGSDGSSWHAVAAALADRWRVYVPDQRGHGRSDRPGEYSFELLRDDLLGLLDALGLARAALVGHSMGGVAAYLLAQDHPERVERLVLVETPPPVPRGRPEPVRPDEPTPYDWAVVPAIVAQLNAPDPAWSTRLPEVTVPTLVVAGGPSSQLPQEKIAWMAERLPDARLVTIPAGHRVPTEAPADLAAALRTFLAD